MSVSAAEVRKLLDAAPFKSFTMFTTRASKHEITSAKDTILTAQSLHVGRDADEEGYPTRVQQVPLQQVSRIEVD
jgi:hypothetical protein